MTPALLYPPGPGAVLVFDVVLAYGAIGMVFAAVFLAVGLDRVDSNAQGSLAFRPLLVPGLVLLWPLVAWRWRSLDRGRKGRHRHHRAAHWRLWIVLSVLLPGLLLLAMAVRPAGPTEAPPVRLDTAGGAG